MKLLKLIAVIVPILYGLNCAECAESTKTVYTELPTIVNKNQKYSIKKFQNLEEIPIDNLIHGKIKGPNYNVHPSLLEQCVSGQKLYDQFNGILVSMKERCNRFLANYRSSYAEEPIGYCSINDCKPIINIIDEYFEYLSKKKYNGQRGVNQYSIKIEVTRDAIKDLISPGSYLNINNIKDAITIRQFFNYLNNVMVIFAYDITNILYTNDGIHQRIGSTDTNIYTYQATEYIFYQGCKTVIEIFKYVQNLVNNNKTISDNDKKEILENYIQNILDDLEVFCNRFFYDNSESKTKFEAFTDFITELSDELKKFIHEDDSVFGPILKEAVSNNKKVMYIAENNISHYKYLYCKMYDITIEQKELAQLIKIELLDIIAHSEIQVAKSQNAHLKDTFTKIKNNLDDKIKTLNEYYYFFENLHNKAQDYYTYLFLEKNRPISKQIWVM